MGTDLGGDLDVGQLANELEWRRCANDPVYWIENYVKIRVPGRGKVAFRLRDAQRQTLETWMSERYTIALKARQIGFSTLAAAYVVWLCLFHSDMVIVMLSRGEREAQELLQKSKYAYKNLPEWMKARGPRQIDDNLQKMSWDNDTVIKSLPSGTDPARGEAVDIVIVDEWAFLPNAEEAWASIEPITDVGGRVIGISTANGAGNFFHRFYVAAKTGASQFVPIFFPWWANSDRGKEWYEQKKGSMLEWQLHQEYPEDDTECFIRSGNPVYDYDLIDSLPIMDPIAVGDLVALTPNPECREFKLEQHAGGNLRVWEYPVEDAAYVMGIDVAKGLEHGDYSSIHVIRVRTGEVVAHWHGHTEPDLLGSATVWALGWWYNAALAGVEVNNHGLTTATQLRDKGYPNIYWRTQYNQRSNTSSNQIGWYTSVSTKPLLVDELGKALRTGAVQLHCERTQAELQTYVRNEKGQTEGSPFDDRTMSLGLAVQMMKHAVDPINPRERDDYMTFGWAMRMLEQEDRLAGAVRVGGHNRRR